MLAFSVLFCSAAPASDVPPIGNIPNTGNFTARYLKDHEHIAVIELSGDYHKDAANGQFNVEPRTVVPREFYRQHPDDYDFLVVFTGFEYETGPALAFHHAVKRDIRGIGDRPLFDNTVAYGSEGRLQGFIDMAALSRYAPDFFDPGFDQVMQVFSCISGPLSYVSGIRTAASVERCSTGTKVTGAFCSIPTSR